VSDFDRVIDQPADLRSSTAIAVIISSHRATTATMYSIHSLLSENHSCTLFMASTPTGPIQPNTLSHLGADVPSLDRQQTARGVLAKL
jgi:hypothetical protein